MFFTKDYYNGKWREIVCSPYQNEIMLGFQTKYEQAEEKSIRHDFTVKKFIGYKDGVYQYEVTSRTTTIDNEQAILQSIADDVEAVCDELNAILEV